MECGSCQCKAMFGFSLHVNHIVGCTPWPACAEHVFPYSIARPPYVNGEDGKLRAYEAPGSGIESWLVKILSAGLRLSSLELCNGPVLTLLVQLDIAWVSLGSPLRDLKRIFSEAFAILKLSMSKRIWPVKVFTFYIYHCFIE
jgi:hypothetical protein